MPAEVSRRNACGLCGGQDAERILHLVPTPAADDYVPAERLNEVQEIYPLDLCLCHKCGHVQLLDVVSPEALFGNYIYLTASSPGLVEHFRQYAEQVLSRVGPAEGALAVDIGSNDGVLLRFFQEGGMSVLGVDPAREIARKATESGIETLPTFFTSELAHQIKKERGPAALVTANNVFAHAEDLADITEGIRGLLAPSGVFVFEVSYLVDMIQGMVFENVYHEHLCYHTVKPLEEFFGRHGMELIDVERIATKGGSLRGTAQLFGGPRRVSDSVSRFIMCEEDLGLHHAESFKAFATKIDSIKADLGSLLRDLIAEGQTIAGYGASATSTTLIYHFDLGDVMSFIVDDNPSRQGLFSPGFHIPVVAPEELYERKPDYVIVLAWRFSDLIFKKHQAFLPQGGHFILPLPKIEVL